VETWFKTVFGALWSFVFFSIFAWARRFNDSITELKKQTFWKKKYCESMLMTF